MLLIRGIVILCLMHDVSLTKEDAVRRPSRSQMLAGVACRVFLITERQRAICQGETFHVRFPATYSPQRLF
ncbi:hypothetical protein BS17DRAFT_314868 [Gyrodon lividus]|nr:hypothetical protein BS17DRAFT_314868 [Gyrodon lividus]